MLVMFVKTKRADVIVMAEVKRQNRPARAMPTTMRASKDSPSCIFRRSEYPDAARHTAQNEAQYDVNWTKKLKAGDLLAVI